MNLNASSFSLDALSASRNSAEKLAELIRYTQFFAKRASDPPFNHSKYLDKVIGFNIPRIEQKLLKNYRSYDKRADASSRKNHYVGTQTWIGLHPQVLQTPYSELLQIFECLQDYDIGAVTDFGAGYGRVALVLQSFFPKAQFLGFEIIKARVDEAQRIWAKLAIKNARMIEQNILEESFMPPVSDLYFIYDFSEKDHIYQVLLKLERMSLSTFLVLAKGERANYVLKKRGFAILVETATWSLFKKNS